MAASEAEWRPCLLLLFGLLLVMVQVQPSLQIRASHPLHDVLDRVSENGGPYIGLVMTFPTEEDALISSGFFLANSDIPWVDLAGRRFNIGKIRGVDVIYVMSGELTLNAGVTIQVLVDSFDIEGIVHYGIAGSSNNSLVVGDVSVPDFVAFTGSWKWMEFGSDETVLPTMKFGAYNLPIEGDNLLAKIKFTPQELYAIGKPMEEVFWLPVEPLWFTMATQLKDIELQQCLNETFCLPEMPKVVYGLKGATADIFVDNSAFRNFLFDEFNVSTVDEESSAVIMTSLSNGLPCIVFRGVSDLAGALGMFTALKAESLLYLAAVNAVRVAVEFIGLIGNANFSQSGQVNLSNPL